MSPLRTVAGELAVALDGVDDDAFDAFVAAVAHVALGAHLAPSRAHRIFFAGQGRSGLCAAMAAMRFMHLGYDAHCVGEATAPSVRSGDVFVIVSGSGRNGVGLADAEVAHRAGATVLAISGQATSPLSALADRTLVLAPASSAQFGGSLFEQTALLVLDAVVLALMPQLADAPATMATNHTNLGA